MQESISYSQACAFQLSKVSFFESDRSRRMRLPRFGIHPGYIRSTFVARAIATGLLLLLYDFLDKEELW